MLIVSCAGVPKSRANNNEQVAISNEQLAVSSEQAPTELAIAEPSDTAVSVSEPPVLAEAVAEEKPSVEYVETLSMLDDPSEIAVEPEAQSAIVMETLRPAETASLAETHPSAEPTPEPPAKPLPAAVPERRRTQPVPPVRESWRNPPLPPEPPEIALEPQPDAEEQPVSAAEERIIQPDYPITFSRVARVTVGQLVEIPFRGRDWVFIGEVGARRGIAYDSRKMDLEGESFIFRVDAPGVYALKFYRQDFARDLVLNDHVQIVAGGTPETTGLGWFNPPIDRSRVVVGPRWPNFFDQPPQRPESRAEQQLSRAVEENVPVYQPTAETRQADARAGQPAVAARTPTTAQPQAPATTQQPAARAPATAQPPATAQQPKAAPQPAPAPARQPSNARTEPARPQGLSGGTAVAQASPVQQPPPDPPPPPVAEPKNPDTILKEARDEFNAGRIASALTLLDEFRRFYPSGSDEAWWLYGQCYEANSPNRNMLSALDYYRRLVRDYPQSSRLTDARRRVAYLERFYINIQ